jgi:hypothetical protein
MPFVDDLLAASDHYQVCADLFLIVARAWLRVLLSNQYELVTAILGHQSYATPSTLPCPPRIVELDVI